MAKIEQRVAYSGAEVKQILMEHAKNEIQKNTGKVPLGGSTCVIEGGVPNGGTHPLTDVEAVVIFSHGK